MRDDRPKTGLTIPQAFARWADPEDVAKIQEYRDAAYSGVIVFGGPETEFDIRHKIYAKHEARCRAALMPMLKDGSLLASGISNVEEDEDRRKAIHPSMWDVLEIHVFWDRIAGSKRDYEKPDVNSPAIVTP